MKIDTCWKILNFNLSPNYDFLQGYHKKFVKIHIIHGIKFIEKINSYSMFRLVKTLNFRFNKEPATL